MGVLSEFLGFDGQVGRLGYLWRSVVACVALMILAVVGTSALALVLRPQSVMGAVDLAKDVLIGVYLLALWSGFALGARRLRDMGLEPAHIVPVYAALWVVNAVLVEPMSRADPNHFAALEFGWNALQWVIGVPLLFWPSSERRPEAAKSYDLPSQPTAYLNWRESG
jgi:uncharacterized membrane protein YhaH (DUF805 family)